MSKISPFLESKRLVRLKFYNISSQKVVVFDFSTKDVECEFAIPVDKSFSKEQLDFLFRAPKK